MSKKVESKILAYFPQLKRNATWEDAWNQLESEGKISGAVSIGVKNAHFTLYMNDDELTTFTRPSSEIELKDTTINVDPFIKEVFEYLIKYKLIHKPGVKQLGERTDIKRQRDNLTMRIYQWRKAGKDTTELEKQKELLTKALKQ